MRHPIPHAIPQGMGDQGLRNTDEGGREKHYFVAARHSRNALTLRQCANGPERVPIRSVTASTAESSQEPAEKSAGNARPLLVPQPHGGALLRAGTGAGGPGRPPNVIRELLRGGLVDALPGIQAIARGEITTRMRVNVRDIAHLLTCPNCGELAGLEPKGARAGVSEIEVEAAASPKDRVAAFEAQAKYGLGALRGISLEDYEARVREAVGIIRRHVAPDLADTILAELRPVLQRTAA